MRCLIFSPYLTAQRGNSIGALRLASGLQAKGCKVRAYGFCEKPRLDVDFQADVFQGFHGFLFGRDILPRIPADIPLVLTMTGTDYNIDLNVPLKREVIRAAINRAQRVIVFHDEAKRLITGQLPEVAAKVQVIPPGIELQDNNCVADIPGIRFQDKVILIVAGLRKVKNVMAAVAAVAKLAEKYPDVRLIHVGPVLEDEVAQEVRQMARQYPWFVSLGEMNHNQMAGLYRRADVVINTSLSEAIPNSILEAMYCGRPVVVSAIQGNLAVVSNGQTGLAYNSNEELTRCLAFMLDNQETAQRMAQNAADYVKERFSTAREIADYHRVYTDLLSERGV
jgi:glycosyltransferase involved in cell wall biosynthesis